MPVNTSSAKTKGFTLIEIIIGIVVLSISFSVITSLISPVLRQNADQLHMIRAAELGQSMLNEIHQKAFDENSDHAGGRNRCGENSTVCTANVDLGCDGDERVGGQCSRQLFDDVDDYHNLNLTSSMEDSEGNERPLYTGYTLDVTVGNDSNYNGVTNELNDNNQTAKLITVEVTTPMGQTITFSTYRTNF